MGDFREFALAIFLYVVGWILALTLVTKTALAELSLLLRIVFVLGGGFVFAQGFVFLLGGVMWICKKVRNER